MAQKTRAGTAVDLVTVGFAGYSLIRVIQQVRNRATHPNMADPGRRYLMWLPWVLGAVVLLVVVAWWYQLDCSSRCDENIREVIGDALGVAERVRNSALGVALNATNLLGTALTASLSSATAASAAFWRP